LIGAVSPRTNTPLTAMVLVTGVVIGLALWLPLVTLSKTTSLIALMVFATVNFALIIIKRRGLSQEGIKIYPIWLPWAGFITSAKFSAYQVYVLLG
jgi:APA family basic amino acid/polyamine antiporter